jgi:hypothetical protein
LHSGIGVRGTGHSGHTISDGYVYSDHGTPLILPERGVSVRNVIQGPWPEPPQDLNTQTPSEGLRTN